ncbi:N-acyl amino acid synthase FeeM domain-containing protein [Enterovirga sp. CN4-39]|uniref:N-acyl amino acid synthase FeeM domain-containing protein n=1 Tax=Enterovirga sp. CN4-39 TaxID=3400910 RepID=UPI003C0B63EE
MSGAEQAASGGLTSRIEKLFPRLNYKLAITPEYREQIFRLRHDAYAREGAIDRRSDGIFTDEVDEADNTYLFGVQIDGILMSSIRLSVGGVDTSEIPTAHVFPEILGPAAAAGKIIVDPTRFVVDHAWSRRHPELPYITLRLAWIAMEHFEADILLAAVRPEHAAFYRRFWCTRIVAPARDYPMLTKPITLTMADYAEARDQVHARYPFMRSGAAERARVFGQADASRFDGHVTAGHRPVHRGPVHINA